MRTRDLLLHVCAGFVLVAAFIMMADNVRGLPPCNSMVVGALYVCQPANQTSCPTTTNLLTCQGAHTAVSQTIYQPCATGTSTDYCVTSNAACIITYGCTIKNGSCVADTTNVIQTAYTPAGAAADCLFGG